MGIAVYVNIGLAIEMCLTFRSEGSLDTTESSDEERQPFCTAVFLCVFFFFFFFLIFNIRSLIFNIRSLFKVS